jgi:hypothetical protein
VPVTPLNRPGGYRIGAGRGSVWSRYHVRSKEGTMEGAAPGVDDGRAEAVEQLAGLSEWAREAAQLS